MGDWSGKRLLRGSLTRRLRSLKTLTESRFQITLSVRMMAKENKMLLSTTWWWYRYLVACVIPIYQDGVPLLVSIFLCVRFTMESLHLFYYKKKEKASRYQLGFGFSLTTRYEKWGKKVLYSSFAPGVRKSTRVKEKWKGKRK